MARAWTRVQAQRNGCRPGPGQPGRITEPGLQAGSHRVNVEDPDRVRDTVLALLAARYPGSDFAALARGFDDFRALFEGSFPGYLACDTLYHDVRHALDMTLAMARLFDGHERASAPADRLGPRRAILGVLVALLHDSGYRSADFISAYLPQLGFAPETPLAARLVHFTGYEIEIEDIRVDDPKDRMLGWMVGTADLIGQMSDRMYLEKCRDFLYREFVWGEVATEQLPDGREVVRYAESHFDGPNLYQSEIDRNVRFLRQVIETAELHPLRRFCYSLSSRPRLAA